MNIALRHNLMKNTPQREGHAKAVRGTARNCGGEEELHASASRRSGRALAVEVRADKVQKSYWARAGTDFGVYSPEGGRTREIWRKHVSYKKTKLIFAFK